MKKQNLLLFLAFLLLVACGNKSEIKNSVKPRTLAESYGDGTYIYPEAFLPITDIDQYNSTVPNAGPLLSGIARGFMGIGLQLSKNLGRAYFSLIQPLPKIPREYVKDIRLKRVFFYIEPEERKSRYCQLLPSIINGKGCVDYGFLGKMAITVSATHLKNHKGYRTILETSPDFSESLKKRMYSFFPKDAQFFPQMLDPRYAKELLILKYDKKSVDKNKKNPYVKNDEYGDMYIFKSFDPRDVLKVRDYFENNKAYKGLIDASYVLQDSVMVQLKKDPIVSETFMAVYNQERAELDQLQVNFEKCTPKTCLDLKLPDVSLIHMATKDNAIKMEAFMEASDVPETFRLKGFIEFKTKIIPPI